MTLFPLSEQPSSPQTELTRTLPDRLKQMLTARGNKGTGLLAVLEATRGVTSRQATGGGGPWPRMN